MTQYICLSSVWGSKPVHTALNTGLSVRLNSGSRLLALISCHLSSPELIAPLTCPQKWLSLWYCPEARCAPWYSTVSLSISFLHSAQWNVSLLHCLLWYLSASSLLLIPWPVSHQSQKSQETHNKAHGTFPRHLKPTRIMAYAEAVRFLGARC